MRKRHRRLRYFRGPRKSRNRAGSDQARIARRAANKSEPPRRACGRSNRRQRSEEHTSELQSRPHLVCRLLLEKKKQTSEKGHLFSHRTRQFLEHRTIDLEHHTYTF